MQIQMDKNQKNHRTKYKEKEDEKIKKLKNYRDQGEGKKKVDF
jgi:hypothetical protein